MIGIESLPITLIAVSLLILIIAAVGFFQVNSFLSFNEKKAFKESMASLVQDMKLLKASGTVGSFSTKTIKVPPGSSLLFDIDKEIIGAAMPDEAYNVTLVPNSINLTAIRQETSTISRTGSAFFGSGGFSILLHYGDLDDSQMRTMAMTFT